LQNSKDFLIQFSLLYLHSSVVPIILGHFVYTYTECPVIIISSLVEQTNYPQHAARYARLVIMMHLATEGKYVFIRRSLVINFSSY